MVSWCNNTEWQDKHHIWHPQAIRRQHPKLHPIPIRAHFFRIRALRALVKSSARIKWTNRVPPGTHPMSYMQENKDNSTCVKWKATVRFLLQSNVGIVFSKTEQNKCISHESDLVFAPQQVQLMARDAVAQKMHAVILDAEVQIPKPKDQPERERERKSERPLWTFNTERAQ